MNWQRGEEWNGWNLIWKLQVQQRVRVFLWVLAHEKILTNLERATRRMTSSALCVRCREEEESALHAVRDCKMAKEVWERLLPPELLAGFFSQGMKVWLSWMWSKGLERMSEHKWAERMLSVCYLQWRWRNLEVFEGVRMQV